jgi:vacuolar-type H+-ATPase subunit F/Vma7
VGRIVVLGEPVAVEGFALAGATVVLAEGAESVRHAWETLPPDAAIVVLTASAAAVLGESRDARRDGRLTIAMPR